MPSRRRRQPNDDAVNRVASSASTRQPPKSVQSQVNHLLKKVYGGSTKRMAEAMGVTQRSVERWRDGTRSGNPAIRQRLSEDVAKTWQPKVRQREQARLSGIGHSRSGKRLHVPVDGSLKVKGSPKVRGGRSIQIDLTGNEAANFAAATDREGVKGAAEHALLNYFNGFSTGRRRTTFSTFRAGDIEFDVDGIQLD